jgi:hypothetical protein
MRTIILIICFCFPFYGFSQLTELNFNLIYFGNIDTIYVFKQYSINDIDSFVQAEYYYLKSQKNMWIYIGDNGGIKRIAKFRKFRRDHDYQLIADKTYKMNFEYYMTRRTDIDRFGDMICCYTTKLFTICIHKKAKT